MANNRVVKVEGVVEEALPGLLFRVKLTHSRDIEIEKGKEVLAHLAGKMKIHRIRVIPGDRVLIEMPDPKDRRGRIIRRS